MSSDLPVIATFECDIARISFPDDPVTDPSYYEQRLAKFVDDRTSGTFVAENAGGIAGWALVTQRENYATKERYGELRSLYVVESERRSGVAFALMRAVLEFSTKMNMSRLVGRTAFTNDAMRALYAAYGFTARHVVYERQMGPHSENGNQGTRRVPQKQTRKANE